MGTPQQSLLALHQEAESQQTWDALHSLAQSLKTGKATSDLQGSRYGLATVNLAAYHLDVQKAQLAQQTSQDEASFDSEIRDSLVGQLEVELGTEGLVGQGEHMDVAEASNLATELAPSFAEQVCHDALSQTQKKKRQMIC
jgi:hypothetical protein